MRDPFNRVLEVTLKGLPLDQVLGLGKHYQITPHDLKSILWLKSYSISMTQSVDLEKNPLWANLCIYQLPSQDRKLNLYIEKSEKRLWNFTKQITQHYRASPGGISIFLKSMCLQIKQRIQSKNYRQTHKMDYRCIT